MRTKPLIGGAVLLAILLLIAIVFATSRPSTPAITIRHVGSVQSGNITAMTFEIKNHTAIPYVFFPFEIRVRNETGWSKFQGFDITKIHPNPKLAPGGVASYTVNVTNLPAGSVVRFSIRPQKILLGVNGLVRRAELNLKNQGGGGSKMPLNPYDKKSEVYELPTEAIATEEFVEQGPK